MPHKRCGREAAGREAAAKAGKQIMGGRIDS